jgi:hypothetical protein
MDRDTALNKIKKCLALANSSNPHEAAAAMRQAQALMRQHGLTEADVTLADVAEQSIKAPSNTISQWQATLARSVAEAFGCEVYYCRHAKLGLHRVHRTTDVVFVGIGASSEVAGYAFDVLLRQAIRDRQAHIQAQPRKLKQRTKTARGDAFAIAWVLAVRSQLDKFAGNPDHAQLLVSYMAKTLGDIGKFKPAARHLNRHVRDDSYAHGAKAGQQARLDRAINGGTPQSLIEG